MYFLKPGIKEDPERRWNLPDRIFFGHGACHILAGVYLRRFPASGFEAVWVVPSDGFRGTHLFVSDGTMAFDFHGYSRHSNLIEHHFRGWSQKYPGWSASLEPVEFPLLSTAELNRRKMKGPDQYLRDPIARAEQFLDRFDHRANQRSQASESPTSLPLS